MTMIDDGEGAFLSSTALLDDAVFFAVVVVTVFTVRYSYY